MKNKYNLVAEPLTRREHPLSIYLAAENLHRTGAAMTQRQRVLACLRQHGPATGAELGVVMKGDRYAAHRRLAELERMGLAERAGFCKCRVTHQKCQRWRAVKIQKDLFGREIRKDS